MLWNLVKLHDNIKYDEGLHWKFDLFGDNGTQINYYSVVYVQKYTEVEEGHSSVELFICFANNKLHLRGNRK